MNFNWGTGNPAGLPSDYFSIRWTGYVQPLFSETYYFCQYHNDIGRVWVNDQLLFDVNDPNGVENCGTYAMTAGTKYSIKVEFVENVGSAGVRLSWYSPTQYKQTIPASQMPALGDLPRVPCKSDADAHDYLNSDEDQHTDQDLHANLDPDIDSSIRTGLASCPR